MEFTNVETQKVKHKILLETKLDKKFWQTLFCEVLVYITNKITYVFCSIVFCQNGDVPFDIYAIYKVCYDCISVFFFFSFNYSNYVYIVFVLKKKRNT